MTTSPLPPHVPHFMRIAQAAELLSLRSSTILKLIKSGKLPGVRLGTVWRISRADLERFLAANPSA